MSKTTSEQKIKAIQEARTILAEVNKLLSTSQLREDNALDAGVVYVSLYERPLKAVKDVCRGIRKDSYYGYIIGSVATNTGATLAEDYLRKNIDSSILKVRIYQT